MLPIREYFTVVGWETKEGTKARVADTITKYLSSFGDDSLFNSRLIKEIENIDPGLGQRLASVPEACKIEAVFYLFRGLQITNLSEHMLFYNYLQRMRSCFPAITPDPEDLFTYTDMLKACISLMLFEGYESKVKSRIAALTRKPFSFPKAKSPVRLSSSKNNYEIYISAYGRKISLFTTTSREKALNLYTLYALYQICANLISFIDGRYLEEWKDSLLHPLKHMEKLHNNLIPLPR